MKKRNLIISAILILCAIIFTILVKVIDVQSIGPNNSSVGFATINNFFFNLTGVNMIWYNITDWLGIIPVVIAVGFIIIGFIQLIKRKSLLKVDKEILFLGIFYIILVGIYVFFELVVVNCRPILMNGVLEASYPSSHTLMALCICGSTIIVNKKLFTNKISKVVNIFSFVLAIVIVVGRLISGVHWLTDIVGGLLISIALLMSYYTIIQIKPKEKK